MSTTQLWFDEFKSPVGQLVLVADLDGRLRAVGWRETHDRMDAFLAGFKKLDRAKDPSGLSTALRAYFAGELSAIESLPVAPEGTPFQQSVWAELQKIPCGQTRTYGEIARAIGKPAAVRAVGLANGSNPVGVVIPCHRVIGANGTLTGYGGGLPRKQWLLAHEHCDLPLFHKAS